jgi:hypothetical protein
VNEPTLSLPRVRDELRALHPEMPDGVVDLAYRLDVDTDGAESIVVHVVVSKIERFNAEKRGVIEQRVREALESATGARVYFRWRTAAEDVQERRLAKREGLDQLNYAVR